MTARPLLLSLLKVVALSLPVTYFWHEWGGRDAYGDLFIKLSIPIYGFFGETEFLPAGARDRFINYLPFLILMVITPRLSWLRRIVGTLVGFVVLFFVQVIFVYVQWKAFPDPGSMTMEGYPMYLPIMLLCDSFPLILWVIIANEWVKEKVAWLFGTEAKPAQ